MSHLARILAPRGDWSRLSAGLALLVYAFVLALLLVVVLSTGAWARDTGWG